VKNFERIAKGLDAAMVMAQLKDSHVLGQGVGRVQGELPAPEESRLAAREKILALQCELEKLPPVEIVTKHYFSKGLYAREIFIPKGTVLVGKIHKYLSLNILSQGDITILTEFGARRVSAPYTVVSPPLTKRVGYAHEDTVWTTVHATDETDLEKIEDELICPTFPDMLSDDEILALKGGD